MKIENHIRLDGALSRNRKIQALNVGDQVLVRMVRQIGPRKLELDLLGNRVNAHFQGVMPEKTEFELIVTGNKSGVLTFQFPDGNSRESLPFPVLLQSSHSFSQFLRTLGYPPDSFMALFRSYLAFKHRGNKGDFFFDVLRSKGWSKEALSRISFFSLSLKNEKLASCLEGFFPEIDSGEEGAELLDELGEDDVFLFFDNLKKGSGDFFELDSNGKKTDLLVLNDEKIFIASIEFSQMGPLQIVGVENESSVSLNLYYSNSLFPDAFAKKRENLDKKLSVLDKNVYITVNDFKDAFESLKRYLINIQNDAYVDFKA